MSDQTSPEHARTALIVGAGAGISGCFARKLVAEGYRVALAARNMNRLAPLAEEIGAQAWPCDASDANAVKKLFANFDDKFGEPGVVLYNPSARARGPFVELNPDDVRHALDITAYGGFLVGQQAAQRMVGNGRGAIFFTGASASVKGYPLSAPFAMGKFALRGMAQSMARELAPKGIHVAHFVIDGGVRNPARPERVDAKDNPDSMLAPEAIAETYFHILQQSRSAWTWEVELRPWVEKF